MRPGRAVTASVVILLTLASAVQGSVGPQRASLTARLTPLELTHEPRGLRAGARGTFSAEFWPYRKRWETAHYSLTTRRLTGPVLGVHIHTGAPGRNGPILLTLCDSGRCSLSDAMFHAYPAGFVKTMRVLGAYVDVHTKRNPRGELRGQIVIR